MSQATVTAYTGPGHSITAGVYQNVVDIDFQLSARVLRITQSDPPGKITDFALTGSNTITLTASGNNYTLSVT